MATSNLSGLFGDVTRTARDYDLQQLEGMLVSPAQMGAQGAGARAASLMGNRGAMVGVALNRLLGGKTSEEVRNSRINDAMKKVSQGGYTTEYEKMTALAQELGNMGMGAEAQQALDRATKMQMDALNIQKAQKDLEPELYRDEYVIRTVKDPDTGEMVDKQFRVTKRWNAQTNRYEVEKAVPDEGGGKGGDGGGNGDENPLLAQKRKREAAAAAKQGSNSSATPNPVVTPAMPQPRMLPPQGNPQLTEAERLQQEYYRQQQAANPPPVPAPVRQALPPLTFNSVEEQENAMRKAVAMGDRQLAMRIRDAVVGNNR